MPSDTPHDSAPVNPVHPPNYDSAFRALARLINIGVITLTPARSPDFISRRALELFQWPADADPEASWARTQPLVDPILDRATSPEAPVQQIVPLDDAPDAPELLLEVHRLSADHGAGGYLVLVKDNRALERVEYSLRLAMQMRTTGQLYQAMAHDLRQPIGAILIHLKVLEELGASSRPVPAEEATSYHETLNTIRSEVRELDASLQLLLRELSPTDTRDAVPLREVVKSVARLIAPQVDKAGLSLVTDLPDEHLTVQGWRFRIKQAILNLATNALEAMSSGTLTLRLYAEDNEACIAVADEGPGIPTHVQARMYERHYTTKPDGTGLGLHLVKETATVHGGRVDVESTLGEGTTFFLYLPLAGAASPDRSAHQAALTTEPVSQSQPSA